MSTQDPKNGKQRRDGRLADPLQTEPSMSAPQPMPGKPAASYVQPRQSAPASNAEWQPPQQSYTAAQQGWSGQQPRQSYPNYSAQQGYAPPPSQGIPGGQLPPRQYGAWQQGFSPSASQQSYQQPVGRGWSQPYASQPVQQPSPQSGWQNGYNTNQWNGNGYAPVLDNMLGTRETPRPPQKKHPMSRATILKLIAAAAALVVALVLVAGLMIRQNQNQNLYNEVNAYNDRYCQGVYVDGIHLGGMTREEAYNAVQKSAQQKCDEWHVQLVTPGGVYLEEINSKSLGMTVHVDDALEAAWIQGHTGATVQERKAAMDALLTKPYEGSTALPNGNAAEIDNILYALAEKQYIPAEDAYEIFDPSVTLGTPFTIVPEVVGQYLNVGSVKDQIYDMVSRMESGVITLEPTPIYPTVTKEQVANRTSLIASAYTKISTTSTEERDANIARAAELINGTKIAPGKTFSFNNVVGARTRKNGFYIATVYAYGKEEAGYGGGVCQVSSTMYWAAIRANLEIVKREQHALKVGYTDLGFDATVNYDGRKIDFSFRNTTSNPIYIITKVMLKPNVDKNRYLVICDIYGEAPEPGVTYDIAAIETEIPVPLEIKTVKDETAQYVMYTDETHTVPGTPGTQVDSYKVKYINGEEVERTHLYTDTYKPVETVTYVGVTERPLPSQEPWY